jgi:hypothetical protein
MTGVTSNLLQIQVEVGLQFLHVELEVAHFGEIVHLLDEEHGVVLRCCHQ